MTTVIADILAYLETLAAWTLPWTGTIRASSWETGHLAPVPKVLVALDPFEDAARESHSTLGAELIVTHHPLFFGPIKSLTGATGCRPRRPRLLIQNNISLWSGHTDLDIAPGGVNDILAKKLWPFPGAAPFPQRTCCGWAALRRCLSPPLRLETREIQLQAAPVLRYVDAGRPCRRIAVGGGACGVGTGSWHKKRSATPL